MRECQRDGCTTLTNNPKYCGRSCAGKVNNHKYPKRGLGERYCKNCGLSLVGKSGKIYCSANCQHGYTRLSIA